MTFEQEKHLNHIKAEFVREVDIKYRAGALEHGGDIRDIAAIQLVREIKAEAVDLFVYADTLESKLVRAAAKANAELAEE